MKLNISDFRNTKPAILEMYTRGLADFERNAPFLPCPLIAAYTFILEEDENEEIRKRLQNLMKFYQVTKVVEE